MNLGELGEAVRIRRKGLKLTQQELADLAEVNINTVVAIESGEGNPKVETILQVAEVLGMQLILKLKD